MELKSEKIVNLVSRLSITEDLKWNRDRTDFRDMKKIEKLGSGSYGSVSSYMLPSGDKVAIKKMTEYDGEGITPDALKEMSTLRVLSKCKGIVQMYGVEIYEKSGDTIVKVMLSIHTSDMSGFIKSVPTLERLKYLGTVVEQLLDGMYYMYDQGIIHRDIKSSNILVDYDYSKVSNKLLDVPKCYIADFGTSKQLSCDGILSKFLMTKEAYTSWYRAPEVDFGIPGRYTYNADVWAMGITFIDYLTGKHIFDYDIVSEYITMLILETSTEPVDVTTDMKNTFKQQIYEGEIHSHVKVDRYLSNNMSKFHYNMIPPKFIDTLTSMLQINPNDRPYITDLLITYPKCPRTYGVSRCKILVDYKSKGFINNRMVKILVDWMLDVCKIFAFSIKTTVLSIDILFRVLSNFEVEKDLLQLYGVTSMFISSKLNEVYFADIEDFVYITDDGCTSEEIKSVEINICYILDYIFVQCDTDELVNILENKYNGKDGIKMFRKALLDSYSEMENNMDITEAPYDNIIQRLI